MSKSKSLNVKEIKRVVQLQSRFELFFSYTVLDQEQNVKSFNFSNTTSDQEQSIKNINLSEITHAHGIFNNIFIFCTRLNESDWRIDFVSENDVGSCDVTSILKTVLYTLRLKFDLNNKVVLGSQAKLAYGIKYNIDCEQHRIIFELGGIYKLRKRSLQLKFNFLCKTHINHFVAYLSCLKEATTSFLLICQEKNFKYIFQMLKFLLKRAVDFSSNDSVDHVVLYLSNRLEYSTIIKFIHILNKDRYIRLIKDYKESIDISKVEAAWALEFFAHVSSFKGHSAIKPIVKFPGSSFTLSYVKFGSNFHLSLRFGLLTICNIKEYDLFAVYKKTYRFYFALKLLYTEVGEVKVIDALIKHKLLIT